MMDVERAKKLLCEIATMPAWPGVIDMRAIQQETAKFGIRARAPDFLPKKIECDYKGLHFEVDPDHPSSIIVTEVGFGPPEGSSARDFFDALKPRDG